MTLTDTQKAALTEWVEAGAELGEIQSRLKDEFEINLTYLDTRFLLADLGLELLSDRQEDEPPEDEEAADDGAFPPEADEPAAGAEDTPPDSPLDPLAPGGVSVTVDTLAQPHAMVSGKVTFSDGATGAWYLDQMGRLGIDPDKPDHRPSETDIAAFQMELQKVLRQQGF